ncbi:MAG: polymerase sigma factor FliA [Solirubrobacteraceae bacterium]|nr:polymerase sigma factor FliA [Solirubrobacteraceae bacterium]
MHTIHAARSRRMLDRPLTAERRSATSSEVMPVELDHLWRRFRRDGDHGARERLVMAYAPLVKGVAGRMSAHLPSHVEEADLISFGLGGLMTAIDRFEPRRDIKFETYAAPRIKGAILDQLRSLDWVPRSVRTRARAIERASVKLEQLFGRSPSEAELAAEVDMSVPELREVLSSLASSTVLTLDGLWTVSDGSGDQVALVDTLRDDGAPDPLDLLTCEDLRDSIAEALGKLPERERLVVGLYHYYNLTLREIGDVIGVSESRVSQLHTRAMLRLRGWLAEAAFEDGSLAMAA